MYLHYFMVVKEWNGGSSNISDPHKFIEHITIRRCGFAVVGIALLEEGCHYGGGLWPRTLSSVAG